MKTSLQALSWLPTPFQMLRIRGRAQRLSADTSMHAFKKQEVADV